MKIAGIGETLLDVIFRDLKPVSASPGGSVLNTLVSLGRLGLNPVFISDYGNDMVGGMIDRFLRENGVNTSLVDRYSNRNSGLAMAFLDQNNDARYQFYKDYPEKRLEKTEIKFDSRDIFIFSSFFALTPTVRKPLIRFLNNASNAGSLILYDPNFRKPHLPELKSLMPMIEENFGFANIIRASDEDFENIFGIRQAEEAYAKTLSLGCRYLVYTANKNRVMIFLPEYPPLTLEVPELKPVSTIGAGDNFNAGLIWSLYQRKVTEYSHLLKDPAFWEYAGRNGIAFASEVCLLYDNFISCEFVEKTLSSING